MSSQKIVSLDKKGSGALASEVFSVEISGKIAHLRFCRPEAYNTMTPAFWHDLPRLVRHIDDNALARAIIISSTGKHFTAGMDLSVFGDQAGGQAGGQASGQESKSKHELGRTQARFWQRVGHLQEIFSLLESCRMPVLAAIQGGCIGGGMDMISACDMRYCTQDAFFCVQEINLGLTADVGTFPRLGYTMPQGLARELAYTGRRLGAAEALAAGFVNKVYPDHESMLAGVEELAGEIAAKSPLAVWGSKEMLNHARGRPVEEGLRHIALWQSGMFHPQDMKRTFAAHSEKRTPVAGDYDDLLPNPKPDSLI